MSSEPTNPAPTGGPDPAGAWLYPPPPYPLPEVPNHLVLAIVSLILFWPAGLAAVIFSTQVNSHLLRGDYPAALRSSNNAKTFAWIGFGFWLFTLALALLVVIGVLVVFAIAIAAGATA